MKPMSGGTSQPDFATMWHALRGTDYDLGLDVEKVLAAEEVAKDCLKDYFMPPEALAVEPLIPFFPMPGGALTANTQMMRDNNMMDRYPAVVAKMGEVVRRGGFGTSVTPVSQFYFQQAFNNEIFGPWKRIAEGYGKMVLGYFGKTPVEPDAEIVALAAEQLKLEPTTRNPREINDEDPKKGIAVATKRLQDEGLEVNDENIFVVSTCLDKGVAFLKGESEIGVRKVDKSKPAVASNGSDHMSVNVGGKAYDVKFEGGKAVVNGISYDYSVGEAGQAAPAAASSGPATDVKAELAARVFKLETTVGAKVNEGDLLLVLEALKMEIEVRSPVSGVVQALPVAAGNQVAVGDTLAAIAVG
jgi:pyruvate carboxylase subunit B